MLRFSKSESEIPGLNEMVAVVYAPFAISRLERFMETETFVLLCTVTVQVAAWPETSVFAVIVAVPADTAVMSPSSFTVAISLLELE